MSAVVVAFARLKEKIAPRPDRYICVVLALAAFIVYVRTLAPGVLDGDSGEWQYMANILGVPHSTGYPLYILLAKIVTFLPVGSPAWRVNLFSAICAALTIPVVYLLTKRVARLRVAAILAALFFAFMPTLWASATIAEVYALNTLLIALTLFFAIRFYDTSRPRDLYLMALCFGLALDNHRIAFFIAPALLLVVWLRRSVFDMRKLAFAALALLIPITLYLYIPLRASQLLTEQTAENWALYPRAEAIVNGKITAYYNPTFAGFINLVTAFDNRTKLGFQGTDGDNQTSARLSNAWVLLREQIDPFGIVLALAGILILLRRERALAIVLLVAGASVAAISVVLRAESTRFYFSGAYLVMVMFLAIALGWILDKLRERAQLGGENRSERGSLRQRTAWQGLPLRGLAMGLYYLAILFFAFFPLTALYFNFARMDQSANIKYDTYARNILNDNLGQNAVLVAPWEVATPIRYFQYIDGVRPDVLTIHDSPIASQYQKLLDAAHKLNRPFYYAQFTPEDKNSDGPRTIQAVAFPLPNKPAPQFKLSMDMNPSVRVIGYDWTQTGNIVRLALYYRVLKPTRTEYVTEVEVGDPNDETRGLWSQHPVSEYYPTYLWQDGQYYRDVYDVVLDSSAPGGDYVADVSWYEYDASIAKRNEATAKAFRLTGLHVQR